MPSRVNEHAEREKPPRGVRRLWKDYELSAETGIPVDTLRADRIHARRIPFLKLGRSVWYDLDAVLAALQQFRVGGAARSAPRPGDRTRRGAKRTLRT